MKLSLNWIRDYVDLPQDMDLKRLAYDLTMSTVEVEDAEDLARRFDHMIVGVVQEICQHPNADQAEGLQDRHRRRRHPRDRLRRREPARRNEGRRGLPRRHVPLAR